MATNNTDGNNNNNNNNKLGKGTKNHYSYHSWGGGGRVI